MSLLPRDSRAVVFRDGSFEVSGEALLSAAAALAAQLGGYRHLLNLCSDRVNFTVGLLAGILAGRCSLLPPNRQSGTILEFLAEYPEGLVLFDDRPPPAGLPAMRLEGVSGAITDRSTPPVIAAGLLCALVFTSGSTGRPKANPKYWRTLGEGTRINSRGLFADLPPPTTIVATVPPNHMYGLETSVLIPLSIALAAVPSRPFYPADVAATLARQPEPRVLVSTPVHLQALLASRTALPHVERVLSATAPLSRELAGAIEKATGGELLEVYGCTETGCLASRRPTGDLRWRLLDGFSLEMAEGQALVSAGHLPEAVVLQDRLEPDGDGCFHLVGRHADLVNVAGKRGSLSELTQRLLAVPGVADGVVFQADPGHDGRVDRVVGLVVSDLPLRDILSQLAETVDPALLPRPLLRVAELPRGATGKLDRIALLELYASLARDRR